MSNIDRIRKYYGTMDAGEKQYMANKLWKEDKVCPALLRGYIPEEVLQPRPNLKLGQFVVVTRREAHDESFVQEGAIAIIDRVDTSDEVLPYRVKNGNGQIEWLRPNQVKPLEGN